MGNLTLCVFEDHLAGDAPVALGAALVGQGMGVELPFRNGYQQLPMFLLLGLQSGQIAQAVVGVSDGQFVVQIGPVADEEYLVQRPAVPLQETTQPLHVLLNGGQVSYSPGPQPICRRDVAIGRHVQPGLELTFVHRRVMGKTEVDVLAVGVGAVHDESRQVIENQ